MLSPSPLTEAKFKFDRHVVPILRLHILGVIVNSSSSLHHLVGIFCQSTVGRRRLRRNTVNLKKLMENQILMNKAHLL
ncbi:hypothetical protein Ahy_B08g091513 isoform G [Arachis hypogaea]|uniref:Uncharacterized protein n=1 Tax=Arachis hypogaea TaxID=3818 RepID=A0A444Y2F2_ARAHY|nr:hypothetical protein Ahy_B08g091513 isoform G [Arachis hypogaea]